MFIFIVLDRSATSTWQTRFNLDKLFSLAVILPEGGYTNDRKLKGIVLSYFLLSLPFVRLLIISLLCLPVPTVN